MRKVDQYEKAPEAGKGMNRILKIMQHELRVMFQKKAFWVVLIGVPLVGIIAFFVITNVNRKGSAPVKKQRQTKKETKLEGYVDVAGILQSMPEDLPAGMLKEFPDEKSAMAALDSGDIKAYYVIPDDFIDSGKLIYVNPKIKPFSTGQSWIIRKAIFANLIGNEELVAKASQPMNIQEKSLATKPEKETVKKEAPFQLPYFSTLLLVVTVLMSSGYLLHSLAAEKQNRILEILLLSSTPYQLLTGKIIALGLIGIFQVTLWLGSGYLLVTFFGSGIPSLSSLEISPAIIIWGIGFFLLGYAIYAGLNAALGTLTRNIKESTQSTFLVIFPLVFPMIFIVPMIENPNSMFTIIISYIPFTAPVGMMVRLTVGEVALWEIAFSYILMALTAWFIIRSVARIFHAQLLLSGEPFAAKRFFKAILGRLN